MSIDHGIPANDDTEAIPATAGVGSSVSHWPVLRSAVALNIVTTVVVLYSSLVRSGEVLVSPENRRCLFMTIATP